jgi:hypothetical protein
VAVSQYRQRQPGGLRQQRRTGSAQRVRHLYGRQPAHAGDEFVGDAGAPGVRLLLGVSTAEHVIAGHDHHLPVATSTTDRSVLTREALRWVQVRDCSRSESDSRQRLTRA